MSDRLLESRTRTLSLAVAVVDTLTGGRPQGNPRVTVDGDPPDAENRSGYALFFDRAGTVAVRVEGGDHYLNAQRTVALSELASTSPVVTVELTPGVAYRFGRGATLLRGFVREKAGSPVTDASVSVLETERATTTDANGEFVLSFDPVTADDVVAVDDRKLVHIAGGAPRLVVSVDGSPVPVTAATADGETIPLDGAGAENGDPADGENGPGRSQGQGQGGNPTGTNGTGDTTDGSEDSETAVSLPVSEGEVTTCEIVI